MAGDVLLLEFRGKTDKFLADSKAVTDSINKSDNAVKNLEKDATKAYNKAGDSAKGFAAKTNQIGSAFNTLGNSAKAAFGMIGIAVTTQAVVEFGKKSVEAFIDAEKNAQLLLFALKGNEQAQQRMLDQATRIQNTTIFDDDSIQQAQTFLATQGRNEKQIQKVIDAAIELSTVTGVDLQTAVMQLDGTFEGNIGKMGKLDSAFKDLTKEQLANGAAADLLIKKYGGTAKAMGDTTAGQIAKLKNQFGELQETVGGELVGVLAQLTEGLNQVSKGDSINGLDNLLNVFDKLTTIIQYMPQPLAGIIRGVKEFSQAFTSIKDGNIIEGVKNGLEGVANIMTWGVYDTGKKILLNQNEIKDSTTDYEKSVLKVVNAKESELKAQVDLLKAQGASTAELEKFIQETRQAELDKIFNDLSQSLEITKQQFAGLVSITDKYGISARIASSQILAIKEATSDQLKVAFEQFHTQLGVSQKDWDDYIGKVKDIPPVHEEVADSTTKMVGPFDALNQKLAAINKQMLDYLTLGKDAVTLDRERFQLQSEINDIQQRYNDLLNSHNPIATETAKTNDLIKNTQEAIKLQMIDSLPPIQAVNTEFTKGAPKVFEKDLQDLEAEWQNAANIAGALANLAQSLNTALTQIFGEAAEKNAVFAAFQKAITISTITFKSIEAVANGVAAFTAGVASGDPTKIIGGVASVIAGVGNLIGGLIEQVNSVTTPKAPSFFEGTEFLQRGGNPKGIDTIPIWANEGEAIIPTDKNKRYPGLAKAWINGDLENHIITNWVAPALKDREALMKKEFAENIAASLMLQPGSNFDDYRLYKEAKSSNMLLQKNNELLSKSLRKNNPWGIA